MLLEEGEAVYVVLVRNGPAIQALEVFRGESVMEEAGYRLADMSAVDWPHMNVYIQVCRVNG